MFKEEKSLKLAKSLGRVPKTLIVLGTGWDGIVAKAKIKREIEYQTVFGVEAGVEGHEGRLVVCQQAVMMMGRLHVYEGYSAKEATLPIRVLGKLGVKKLIVTSAVGALNPSYRVGDIVIVKDVLSLGLGESPLVGPNFVDLGQVFDRDLQNKAEKVMKQKKIAFRQGVHAFYRGPQFESPADKKALRKLGGDVVGMSLHPEVIMGKALGMKVLGLGFVTNLAFVKHSHKDVQAVCKKEENKMVELLEGLIYG